ncbi:flavin reductase-like, FMN-binding protein [Novosphingobium aromaticivorans DSM 12444]|uniref:Flavin reductase-like, FMN-binding protein n=1 Tax=Novosphingobium aromaticivorans (strain ATCC 700278 / DSM 12444 / CCUG 56034 / CIP 105152 / NBRC 16084 / F199) TaxID=279238 RepID=Q2G8B8_NOVAD|nr:flavin reductase family protein [Novosphingobium aromaticivorans]ABD25905.1 flavin reductase-like, FMN-binding protein [Novosphingobium aromaticivorans DSM 12444]SCY97130.1 NADH-FMN oxidoreductase RutF, flavin reductase (DIM6/NTAB) family [Novosphingobium aromaticivorans]
MTIRIDPVIEGAAYRRVLGHYPTGVCVVTATLPDGRRAGMVVGSFTSVSLDPPLVGFFPDVSSSSWPQIEAAGRFCVNILASDQKDLCRQFSAKGEDKFAGLTHADSANGSPVLDGVVAWIDCTLDTVHEAGDHYIVLGRVQEMDIVRPEQPLLFFRGGYGSFAPLFDAASE